MNVDIRIPIGGMFGLIGLILAIYGLLTFAETGMYQRSLGINVNLWWGLAMLVFGLAMLLPAMRRRASVARSGSEKVEEIGPARETQLHR